MEKDKKGNLLDNATKAGSSNVHGECKYTIVQSTLKKRGLKKEYKVHIGNLQREKKAGYFKRSRFRAHLHSCCVGPVDIGR